MPKQTYQIVPFTNEHIAPAAQILAAQSASLRSAYPLLPERVADESVAREFLAALMQKETCQGMALLKNGKRNLHFLHLKKFITLANIFYLIKKYAY